MKKMVVLLVAFAATAALSPAPLWAQAMTARVTEINEQNRSLTVIPTKTGERLPERIELILSPQAELEGIDTLRDLEVGDEIQFEGVRQSESEWKVDKLEIAQTFGRGEVQREGPGFFKRFKVFVQSRWYRRFASDESERLPYAEAAEKRLSRWEARGREVKEQIAVKTSEQAAGAEIEPVELREKQENMNTKLDAARSYLESLRRSNVRESWNAARVDFEKSLNAARRVIRGAASQVLSTQTIQEWDLEDNLFELRGDFEVLKRYAAKERTELKSSFASQFRDLENRLQRAEQDFSKFKQSRGAEWDSQRIRVEDTLTALASDLYDVFAKIS